MGSRLRNVPLVLVVVGLVMAFPGPDIVSSERTGFLLAVGGSVLTWGSYAVLVVRNDDLLHDAITDDERIRQHMYRSATVTLGVLIAVMTTLLALHEYYPDWVEPDYPVVLLQMVAIFVFIGAWAVFERRM